MTAELAPLVDPDRVTAALANAGARSAEADSLQLDRAWPAKGGGLTALYRSRPGAEKEEAWTLISCTDERPPSALRRLSRNGHAAWLEELGTFALAFPHDPRLPDLEQMLDPDEAARSLAPRILGGLDFAEDLEPRVLRYKPLRRCVIEYRINPCKTSAASLFCKAQRRWNDIETRKNHLAIQKREPSSGRLRIAHPVGSVDDWNMLVWSPAPGRPLSELFDQQISERALGFVAGALAEFHGSGANLAREHARSQELRTLATWLRIAAGAHPVSAPVLRNAYALLMKASNRIPPANLVPSHRDFHQGQILLEDDQVVFLDLDTAAMSEPELDVGNFLAHLMSDSRHRDRSQKDSSAACFRDAYERQSGQQLNSARLIWYQASSLVRLACVYSFRPGWSARTAWFVDRACNLLDEIAANPTVT